MSKKEETKFSEKVDKDLKRAFGPLCFFENIQQVVKSGTPDRLCCINGQFVALELKVEGGKLSKIQWLKLQKIKQAGGLSFLVTPDNWESCLEKLKKLLLY